MTLGGFAWASLAPAALVNSWDFRLPAGPVPNGTVILDSVSAQPAVVRGQGAISHGEAINLPGLTSGYANPANISAYIELPNGLISTKREFTIELWISSWNWNYYDDTSLLSFGRAEVGDGLGAEGEITGLATTQAGATSPRHGIELIDDGYGGIFLASYRDGLNLLPYRSSETVTAFWGESYFVITYQGRDTPSETSTAGGRLTFYAGGSLIASYGVDLPLGGIEDVNNWLGRSLYNWRPLANMDVYAARIYDHALTSDDVGRLGQAGPTPPAPLARPQEVSIHPGLAGWIQVRGRFEPAYASGVQIEQAPAQGTANVDARGLILYSLPEGVTEPVTFTYSIAGPGGRSEPATVTVTPAAELRIPTTYLEVPYAPPTLNDYHTANALPGLSFDQPVAMASPPGDSRRLFVVEKTGAIQLVPDTTAAVPTRTTFLDLDSVLGSRNEYLSSEGECGLLCLAFHPAYADNRQFFVFYSVYKTDGMRYQRVSRFEVSAEDPTQADPDSERVLIEQQDRASNHNGGNLAFGPDGYLYISFGDEGESDDYFRNGQRIDLNFFAAIARIDVDRKTGSLEPNLHPAVPRDDGLARYAIPPDNPWIGATSFNGLPVNPAAVRSEFWAVGLRNPWRFSFDSVTGDLWCADVGERSYERIDKVVRGGNYGWPYREGSHPGPLAHLVPEGFTALDPFFEYAHGGESTSRRSVTGGFVYRGSRMPELTGRYVFGDFASGDLWSLASSAQAGGLPLRRDLIPTNHVAAFAPDPANGDVLMAVISEGRILRLMPGALNDPFPQKLSELGVFTDLATLAPAPGFLPYEINLPFWSDHAETRRWFALPDPEAGFLWSKEAGWPAVHTQAEFAELTPFTVWVKHFELELVRGDPVSKRRLETRLLVTNQWSTYGVSYRWNEAQTDATLVPAVGASIPLTVVENGVPRLQTWQIPSRASCLACHNPQAGPALGFDTRQLNRPAVIHGFSGNQLDLLHAAGYLADPPPTPNTLPRHARVDDETYPVEFRARSYLAVNCAQCHRAGGSTPGSWDARAELPLAATGLLDGLAHSSGGDPLHRLVVPGDPARSELLHRLAGTGGFGRMPPVGSNEIDTEGQRLLRTWIEENLLARESYAAWRLRWLGTPDSPAGAAEADPDGDGESNWSEYLAATSPVDGASLLQPEIDTAAGLARLTFEVPENRSFQVETSTDLAVWALWDVPGNDGVAWRGGIVRLSGPLGEPRRFFRLRLWEN